MRETQVVIIGGGATGAGILRDLSMRGVRAVLFEQGGLAHGTSSRFHGLLHSGGRYAVSDAESARECIEENMILRRIAAPCVEETEGFFVRTQEDDADFAPKWIAACAAAGISARPVSVEDARRLEPNITPLAQEVYRVPDSCVDGFRLVWHNALAARRLGGEVFTRQCITDIEVRNGAVCSVGVKNCMTGETWRMGCQFVVNAAGSWAGTVAHMAGLDVQVSPDRGTLVVFNHRFTSRVVNRLHKSSDGDIFVPHGSVTILGTTSTPTEHPEDITPTSDEVRRLLDIGEALFPRVRQYRILRAFAGTRPLYTPSNASGRAASRNFHIVDHKNEGLEGMAAIFGGKLTTYRLMAERMSDLVCARLGVDAPCRTAVEPIAPPPGDGAQKMAAKIFPTHAVPLLVDRLGSAFDAVVDKATNTPRNELLCECEMVTMAEVAYVAQDSTTHTMSDIRLRTRLGMGTCQGTFCALRTIGALVDANIDLPLPPLENVRNFMQERWRGLKPALWGTQLKDLELQRAIYANTLNLDNRTTTYTAPCSAECNETATSTATGTVTQSVIDINNSIPHTADDMMTPYETVTEAVQWRPSLRSLPARHHHADINIVGSGLAGLTAALFAAKKGLKVTVITVGNGTLAIGSGSMDVLGYTFAPQTPHTPNAVVGNVFSAMDSAIADGSLAADHPYTLLGTAAVKEYVEFFAAWCADMQAPLHRNADGSNLHVPTLMGTLKPCFMTSAAANPTPLFAAKRIVVAGIEGFRDFHPRLIISQLLQSPLLQDKDFIPLMLPSPLGDARRSATPLDLARYMDSHPLWLAEHLAPGVKGADAVLVPPLCGTQPEVDIWHNTQEHIGCALVESLSIPPGVGGVRVRELFKRALRDLPVTIVENAAVCDAVVEGIRCKALLTQAFDGEHAYVADAHIIATGGILGGGIRTQEGIAREAVFGLPIDLPPSPEDWGCKNVFDRHPYTRGGVRVNNHMQALGPAGALWLDNVYFTGRNVAGFDPASEKCGNGVGIATALAAVRSLTHARSITHE